jgi:hypothetical protein
MELGFENRLHGYFVLQLEELEDAVPPALDVLALPFKNMPPLPIGSVVEWKSTQLVTELPIELTLDLYTYFGSLEVRVEWRDKEALLALITKLHTAKKPVGQLQNRRLVVNQEFACMTFNC